MADFDFSGGVDPTLVSSYGGNGMLLPQLAAAYQRDPRRLLVESMMNTGQQSLQQPTLSRWSGLAKALTMGIGGASGAMLDRDYRDQNAKAQGNLRDALAAMQGTPASTDADGNPVAATAGDFGKGVAIMAKDPALAPMAAQAVMSQAATQSKSRLELINKLAEQHLTIDLSGKIVPMAGAPDAVKVLAQADAQGKEGGTLAAQAAGKPAVITATAPAEAASAALTEAAKNPALIARAAGTKSAELTAQTAGEPALINATAGPKAAAAAQQAAAENKPLAERAQTGADIDAAKQNKIQSFKDDAEPVTVEIGGNKYATTKGAIRAWQAQHGGAPAPSAQSSPAAGNAPAATSGQPAPLPGAGTQQPPVPPQASGAPTPAPAAPAGLPGGTVTAPNGMPAMGGTPADTGLFKEPIAVDAKEVTEARQQAITGQKDLATIQTIQDFLPKVRTGWGAETQLEGARILKGLGVPQEGIDGFMKTNVADGQLLNKKFLELSSAAARQMGAREPGSVIMMFGKAYPNLGTDEDAIKLQTNALKMDRVYQQRLADAKTNYFTDSVNQARTGGDYRGLKGFNDTFNAQNAPENYLHAAEAMSGHDEAWKKSDPKQWDAIIGAMPSGTRYMGPDGTWRMRK